MGSSLKNEQFKPMLPLHGEPMVARLVKLLRSNHLESILCAFNTAEQQIAFDQLEVFRDPQVSWFHVDTPSSMHTLWEVFRRQIDHLLLRGETHLLVSMVDTVLYPHDLQKFIEHCRGLGLQESAILTTSYIDDEKPLYVELHPGSERIKSFGAPNSEGTSLITSGMYCFSREVFPLLQKAVEQGVEKMRNFLAEIVKGTHGQIIYSFAVEKTFDVDRPEDVPAAENFLSQEQ